MLCAKLANILMYYELLQFFAVFRQNRRRFCGLLLVLVAQHLGGWCSWFGVLMVGIIGAARFGLSVLVASVRGWFFGWLILPYYI